MNYEAFSISKFFKEIDSEDRAIELVWKYKSESGYKCPKCKRTKFYQHKNRPEIRECAHCSHQHRLRVDTIFQNSKLPMLTWVRAIYLMMMGKRGISALELQRNLDIKSYRAALLMLRKIRFALMHRDSQYKLEGVIEMDGANFGKRATDNQEKVIVAVESKDWVDDKGKPKSKAGFAKVYFSPENSEDVESFITKDIRICSELHTDAAKAYEYNKSKAVTIKSKPMYNDHERLEKWLPWVHRFIGNAKAWVLGTHHGVNSEYFKLYLSEYTYRFNRRHDIKRFFSRALHACILAPPSFSLP